MHRLDFDQRCINRVGMERTISSCFLKRSLTLSNIGIQWNIIRIEGDVVVNVSEQVRAGRFGFCTAWLAACLREKMCIYAGDSRIPLTFWKTTPLLGTTLTFACHRCTGGLPWMGCDLELVGAIGWSSGSPSVRWGCRCGWVWAPRAG